MAVARALVSRPSVMFADEPTGNLDSTTGGEILALLRDSVDSLGQTTVMVTHDAHAAAIADRVLFLADGHIVRDLGRSTRARDPRGARGDDRAMIAVALKGLVGRKVRALLTAFAVVIGVAMVSGTFVLTDTIQKAFDGIFTASYEQTDAVIAGKEIVKGSQSGAATVPESLLAKVRALPEVEAAGGTIAPIASNEAEIFGRDGKALGSGGAPQFGLGNDASQPQFSPLKLKTGQWPEGPKQVALDAGTAAGENFKVGDTVTVSTLGAKRRYEVTGIATFGGVDSLGGATMAIWDLPTAQTLLDKEGRFDSISIAAKEGTSSEELVRAVQPLVPASLEVKDSEQQAAADAKETNVIVNVIRYFLLGFGAIALFVGAFVIFNTLSITVAQRTREFATLRTLGASRKQVMRSVVIEGLVIGLLASVVGLFAGVGLAKLLTALGGDLPEAGMVFALRTVLISLALGTVITLLASIMPALRATRVPPIAAVREGSTLPPSRFAAHSLKTAIVVIAASVAAISVGIFASGLGTMAVVLLLGIGILALFLGVALAAPHMVKPLTRLVGLPARRSGGIAGDLASANSVRNPSRTASTAAALMIGLTLVTVVAVLGAGLRSTVESAVTDQVNAAYIVNGNDGMPFEAAEGDALARVPGVNTASHVRVDKALVAGEEQDVTGVDPATIARFYTFDWTDGSDAAVAQLGTDGALVTQTYADDQDLAVGDPLSIQTASGDKLAVVVARHLRPARDRADARLDHHRPAGVRRGVPPAQEPVHLPRRRTGREPGADRGGGRLQRRHGAHRRRLRERLHGGLRQLPELPLRAAGVLGRREPVRDGQHARAQRVRAHARARDAADDRDDAPAGAPDDPPRERHHGADRRRARASARHLPRAAGDAGAVAVRHRDLDPDPGARRLHGGRHPRRPRGGDHPGPPGLAAERARRAARARRPALRMTARSS